MTSRKKRTSIPQSAVDELMFRNRHTCCACRTPGKHTQIHHMDSDPSNNSYDNLIVLCLDCHSRATSDEGLGRKFSVGELRLYKREWESLNSGQFKSDLLAKSVEKELLKADISRLMIQAISLNNINKRLEAIKQIESYNIYFGMEEFVLQTLHTILIGSVWSEPRITTACAETLQNIFLGLASPDHVPMEEKHEKHLGSAISSLQWIAEHATEELRSSMVQTRLFLSLGYIYEVAVAYERHNIALSILDVVKIGLKACCIEIEFKGIWYDGVRIILKNLRSMKEITPSGWDKEIEKIEELELFAKEKLNVNTNMSSIGDKIR